VTSRLNIFFISGLNAFEFFAEKKKVNIYSMLIILFVFEFTLSFHKTGHMSNKSTFDLQQNL
jgi:hypothetical protein